MTEVKKHDGTFLMIDSEEVVSRKVAEFVEEELKGVMTVLQSVSSSLAVDYWSIEIFFYRQATLQVESHRFARIVHVLCGKVLPMAWLIQQKIFLAQRILFSEDN